MIVMKNLDQICCDGVNIAILVWKGNKFVEKNKCLCVFFVYGVCVILSYLTFSIKLLEGDDTLGNN